MKKKKFSITLIEIMIVILLIGMITGALAFNMSGSMDKGRAFKTEQNIMRIKDILMLEYATGNESLSDIAKEWEEVVARSSLVLNKGADLMKDGWKEPLKVSCTKGEIVISSTKFEAYKTSHEKQKK